MWTVILLVLWAYRSLYSAVGQVVVTRFTSLGDAGRYQVAQGGLDNVGFDSIDLVGWPRHMATILTETVGNLFSQIFFGNPILINIGFQTIGFVGIAILLTTLRGRQRIMFTILLAFPSFTLWSSVASKEAIVVFALGVIGAYIVKLYRQEARLGPLVVFAFVLVFLFKNHFLPALLFLTVGTVFARRIKQPAFLALLGGLISLVPLVLLKGVIGGFAFGMIRHFEGLGNSREAFWNSPDEVFIRAPEGMFLAFFGPTPSEVTLGIMPALSFVESTALLGILGYVFLRRLASMPIYLFIMSGFTTFWILFTTYPFGVMNAGSAIRYRTGYEILILIAIVLLSWPKTYSIWRAPRPRRSFPLQLSNPQSSAR